MDWQFILTARQTEKREALMAQGFEVVDPSDADVLGVTIKRVDALLVCAPPLRTAPYLCPALMSLGADATAHLKSVIYLSTTGVYGNHDGAWVDETTPLRPTSEEGQRRMLAEQAWQKAARNLYIFRLPGLYGEGQNALLRVREAGAKAIIKNGHVFSRLHFDDAASAIILALQQPQNAGVYNLCDDAPCPQVEVLDFAARLQNLPPLSHVKHDDPSVATAAARFYKDNKRVSNAKAKSRLGWTLTYPNYQLGLTALWEACQ